MTSQESLPISYHYAKTKVNRVNYLIVMVSNYANCLIRIIYSSSTAGGINVRSGNKKMRHPGIILTRKLP